MLLYTLQQAQEIAVELDRTGTAFYRSRIVRVRERPGGGVLFGYGGGEPGYLRLVDVLDRIDAEVPAEEFIDEQVDAGRGGYRPHEVRALMLAAVRFGEMRGRLGGGAS